MTSFKTKKITAEQGLGAQLKQARVGACWSLEYVARTVKISRDFLAYLESSDYDKLPGEIYTKNFIRSYSRFLGLDPEAMYAQYQRERTIDKNIGRPMLAPKKDPVRHLSRMYFISLPRMVRNASITLIVLVCITYLGFKVEAIIRPPMLEVIDPVEDVLTTEKFIDISGTTEPAAHVTINGQSVLLTPEGDFRERVNLRDGINEVKISSRRDHSGENIVYRRVVVQDEE